MFGFRKKRDLKILDNYKKVKSEYFNFERIALFYSKYTSPNSYQKISDSTYSDLDFDEVFMQIDRTSSKVGQQYLYSILRSIPSDDTQVDRLEAIIDFLDGKSEIEDSIVLDFNKLNKPEAYFIQTLLFGSFIKKPRWFWVIPVLSSLTLISILLSVKFSVFLIALMILIPINYVLHYWNKNNVMQYSNAIPQLLTLNKVAKNLLRLGVIKKANNELENAVKAIESIGRKTVLFKLNSAMNDDISQVGHAILEFINTIFLIEPILLFQVLSDLEKHQEALFKIYCAVGEVDTAISISSYRKNLIYYSKPVFSDLRKTIVGKNIYHPLIENPVSNTIDTSDRKSILISGSNMSGKTTFIRTIGINAILAQTINTALAEEFTLPRTRVFSAINILDNLIDNKSYYLEEVLAIKKMIDQCHGEHRNLFLLDELFKGTNTIERISAGVAILSYLNTDKSFVFASTHDLELTAYLSESFNYFHFTEIINNDELSFDYLLKEGKLSKTNAIHILELNEYPSEIISGARVMAEKMTKRETDISPNTL